MFDLRDLVSVGLSAKVSRVVKESDTATNYSTELKELMATPAVIGMAIQASVEAIDRFLPEGYVSIGRWIEYEHTATTILGIEVTVSSTVVEVLPTHMILEIVVTDELGAIGHGRHRRSIVHTESLLARARKRKEQMINSRSM